MQISIVIPTYKRPQLLSKCLKALQLQLLNKQEFEILVISDGPDQETRAAVSDFNRLLNIRYFGLPDKKGPAAARNLGWLNAKAAVVAFTDDDCRPDNRWLTAILAEVDPTRAQAFTGRVIVPRGQRPTDYELNTAGLETADFVTANCACTKLALFITGGFDERFSMAWREDSDLEFKLIFHNIDLKKVNQAMVVHPVRRARWGISLKEQKKTLFNALLYQKFPALYRAKIQSIMATCFILLHHSLFCCFFSRLIIKHIFNYGIRRDGLVNTHSLLHHKAIVPYQPFGGTCG
ncbi:glycosyltransferase family 2 protein [Mucilaginibacter celer]|uniref:glycosyltransferase family 2 protein n=1 Tax=Mucilaginibacter celer TaxID=2305508 RepID=UPI0019694AC1|nr:glycosyltransferase [Mucilaginibacter celer]